jgi:membrane-associated protein
MFHWLHTLLPNIPRYGFVIVFIVVFLNNVGFPLPGEAILLGAGFIVGKAGGSPWQSMAAGTAASFLGGICAFWMGRGLERTDLKKIRWLPFTPRTLDWPQRHFERYGPKAVFTARFIAILPPIAANLLAGMTKMRWRMFLLYNLAGSAVFSAGYLIIGYVLGKQWIFIESLLGPIALYPIVAAIILIVPAIMFRHALWAAYVRRFPRRTAAVDTDDKRHK